MLGFMLKCVPRQVLHSIEEDLLTQEALEEGIKELMLVAYPVSYIPPSSFFLVKVCCPFDPVMYHS